MVWLCLPVRLVFYLQQDHIRADLKWSGVTLEVVSHLLSWVLLIALYIPLIRIFKMSQRFVPLVVVDNWLTALFTIMLLPLAIAREIDLIGPPLFALIYQIWFLWSILAAWFGFRLALQIDILTSIPMTLALILLGFLANGVVEHLIQLPLQEWLGIQPAPETSTSG